jgi:hypothetical protein
MYNFIEYILVGGIPTPLKNMSSSVGIMTFPTEWKVIKFLFQTTNQYIYTHIMVYIFDYICRYGGYIELVGWSNIINQLECPFLLEKVWK